MMKTMVAAAAVLSVAGLSAMAVADDHDGKGGHRGERMLERLDTNKDGNISLDEAKAGSAERFKHVDKNGDGIITPDEAPRMFDSPDANHDGKVTPDELTAAAEARFKRGDTDGDGVITAAEREAHRAAWKEKHDKDEDQPPPP